MLCQTAIVYDRKVGDKVLSFGHEGVLYRRSFVMYDKQTDSLWVHTTGEAINGAMKGRTLTFLPSVVTTWQRWKARHPKTLVLTGKRGPAAMGRFDIARRPERYGLSVGQGKDPKLYPIPLLASRRVISDTYEGRPIVLLWDAPSSTGRAYECGDNEFAWKDGRLVDGKGGVWDLLRAAPAGGSAAPLKALPATPWLVERWQGFYPSGRIYAGSK